MNYLIEAIKILIKWRGRSIQNFLNEMQYLYHLGARRFNFIDCSFEDSDQNCERLRAMAQGIVDLKLDISYFADVRENCGKIVAWHFIQPCSFLIFSQRGLRRQHCSSS